MSTEKFDLQEELDAIEGGYYAVDVPKETVRKIIKVEGSYAVLQEAVEKVFPEVAEREIFDRQLTEYRQQLEAGKGKMSDDRFAAYLLGPGKDQVFNDKNGQGYLLRDKGITADELNLRQVISVAQNGSFRTL